MTETPSLELPSLVTLGDPRLARPSAAVPPEEIPTPEFQARLKILAGAMTAYEGIGIAAPQLGWFERFFLMTEDPGEDEPSRQREPLAWINPEIVSFSREWCWAWEGCLSVPGLLGWIRRPAAVAVRGTDARGKGIGVEYSGWNARVFQHEFDHLDGMLFPYRAADTRHLVTVEALDSREDWPGDWPAAGARDTPQGALLME